MRFSGWFGVFVGLLMVTMWVFFLVSGQVPELETEPLSIYFHLAAEFATALLLLIGGIGLLKKFPWTVNVYLVATGMLIYTVINSPGYYAQQGEWTFVTMFTIILLLALGSIVAILKSSKA